jgi:hypothetical protein
MRLKAGLDIIIEALAPQSLGTEDCRWKDANASRKQARPGPLDKTAREEAWGVLPCEVGGRRRAECC